MAPNDIQIGVFDVDSHEDLVFDAGTNLERCAVFSYFCRGVIRIATFGKKKKAKFIMKLARLSGKIYNN